MRNDYSEEKKMIEAAVAKMKGLYDRCPRCGNDTMDKTGPRNALSRYADVGICSACGTEEAMFDWFGIHFPADNWAVVEEIREEEL